MVLVKKQLAEGFSIGEIRILLLAIQTDLAEIKSKYEAHRHTVAGNANVGTAPSTSAKAAGSVVSILTASLSDILIEQGIGMGFTGKLWTIIQAIETDFDDLKAKYEAHRHSAVGDSDTGTAPSTVAGTAQATASTLTITNDPEKQMAEGFGKGDFYTLLTQIKADLEDFKAKYEVHRHSVAGAETTGTAPSTTAAAAGETISTITLTVE